jgi:hypothetical protein
MDTQLRDEIILAAAEEIMLDARSRFDQWVATRDMVKPAGKDPATAAAGELGVEFFAELQRILNHILVAVPSSIVAGYVLRELTPRLRPALTPADLEAVAKVLEERLAKAGYIKSDSPADRPDQGMRASAEEGSSKQV